jgi:hypothetical protein
MIGDAHRENAPQGHIFPSAITSLAVAILPALFLCLLIADMNSPTWDPNGDNGVFSGAVILAFGALVMIAYAALGFPLVGFWLQRLGRYRRATFVIANFAGLVLVSLGITALVSLPIFGGGAVYFRLFVMMLAMVVLLCLPFSLLWMRLAR